MRIKLVWLLFMALVFSLRMVSAQALTEGKGFNALVLHAEEGDTLLVRPENRRNTIRVRLIGVDAPIRATRDASGQEPWGAESQQWMTLLVTQQQVWVEFDLVRPTETPDVYWGYVWLGKRLLNEELLTTGNAMLDTQPPNLRYVEQFQAAQKIAREKELGVWNPAHPLLELPSDFVKRRETAKSGEESDLHALTIEAWKEGCFIGNRNTRVFHGPDGTGYEKAKKSRNAVFFPTAEAAVLAGYQPAKK